MCASATDLWSVALIGFVVRDLVAVVTLFGTFSTFKHVCGARLPSSHEKSFTDESPSFRTFLEVYDHRAVCLGDVSPAEPCYFRYLGVVLSAKSLGGFYPNFVHLVQHRGATDIIHLDRVKVVSQDAGSWGQFCFRYTLHNLMFVLVPAGDPDAVGVLWVFCHRSASPRGIV